MLVHDHGYPCSHCLDECQTCAVGKRCKVDVDFMLLQRFPDTGCPLYVDKAILAAGVGGARRLMVGLSYAARFEN